MPSKKRKLAEIKLPKAVFQKKGKVVYDVKPLRKDMSLALRITLTNGKLISLGLRDNGKARRSIHESELEQLSGFTRSKWTPAASSPKPPPYADRPPQRHLDQGGPEDICSFFLIPEVMTMGDGYKYICWFAHVVYCDGSIRYYEITCHKIGPLKPKPSRPPS